MVSAADAGAELVILAGAAKFLPLFKQFEEMDVPVALISTRAISKSILSSPPPLDLAENFIDLNEDARFFTDD